MKTPTKDQSWCDAGGQHQWCTGYTEDDYDTETCMCSCHDAEEIAL